MRFSFQSFSRWRNVSSRKIVFVEDSWFDQKLCSVICFVARKKLFSRPKLFRSFVLFRDFNLVYPPPRQRCCVRPGSNSSSLRDRGGGWKIFWCFQKDGEKLGTIVRFEFGVFPPKENGRMSQGARSLLSRPGSRSCFKSRSRLARTICRAETVRRLSSSHPSRRVMRHTCRSDLL